MEGLAITMWPPTAWHWLALGLFLLSIEMLLGTYDLLWIAIAAAVTSMFEAFAPSGITGWPISLGVFAAVSVVLFVLGRTLFRSMRENVEEHPTLNKRMASTIGARVTVVGPFQSGLGRVKLGDTEWSAESVDGSNFTDGDTAIVEATRGNKLILRRA
ncbi:MAG: NfeD family protein [Pseudomonadota bacterium]